MTEKKEIMKGTIWTILAAICCLSIFPAETYAQYPAVPVSISTEKTRMNGRLYYTHVVLEKQTLYSISKAYGVSMQDIYDANPAVKDEGLKTNSIILIPVKETAGEPAAPETAAKGKDAEKTAAAGENPVAAEAQDETTAEDNGKADRRKKDRKKKDKATDGEMQWQTEGNFVIHTVKWYENLDTISEKYGVPVDVIMQVNGLTGRKLSNRQKLRIPADLKAYMEAHATGTGKTGDDDKSDSAAEDSVEENKDEEDGNRQGLLFPKTKVNVTLMLPLNAKDGMGSEHNMDFYCGALLAARDLGMEGTGIDLNVYDTGNGILPSTAAGLEASDVVIGPVSAGDLRKVLEMTSGKTAVISPMDPRAEVLVSSYANLIQAPTASEAQYADLINWIGEEKGATDRTIAIFEKGYRNNGDAAKVDSLLQKSGILYSSFSYSILEGRNVLGSMESLMNPDAVNRVLLVSESEAFVNDVVRNLSLMLHDKYRIVLYGTSKIRGFETINVDDFHSASLHVSLSYHVDYESREVMDFLMKYRALYNTEPGAFAFQGYDILRYFAKMCSEYGNRWQDKLEDAETMHMLQSDFKFRRIGDGGFENIGMRRIIYGPDYTVKPVE